MRCAVGLSPAGRLTELNLQATLSGSCSCDCITCAVIPEHILPDKPAGPTLTRPSALMCKQAMLLLCHCAIRHCIGTKSANAIQVLWRFPCASIYQVRATVQEPDSAVQ